MSSIDHIALLPSRNLGDAFISIPLAYGFLEAGYQVSYLTPWHESFQRLFPELTVKAIPAHLSSLEKYILLAFRNKVLIS